MTALVVSRTSKRTSSPHICSSWITPGTTPMPLILSRPEVLAVYAEAAERRWVHPSFSTENLTTTEAILAAALEHGERLDLPDLPITIALTHRYPERPQSAAYSPTGNAV